MQVEHAAHIQHLGLNRNSVDLPNRELAESVAALERLNPAATIDPLAQQAGRSVEGDLERKLVVYAKSLPVSTALQDAIRHVKHAIVLMIIAAIVLAGIGGVAAARAALATQRDEPVNFYWALGAVLGVQTLFLLLWVAVMILARRSATGAISFATLGGLVMRGGQFIAAKIHKGPKHAAAIAAIGSVHLRGLIGKWTISSISHGVWLVFNISCLLTLIVALSARKYSFAWETTILSKAQYVPLTKAIAALPKAMGFFTPSDDQIAASQWSGEPLNDPDTNQAWSSLLIGCLVIYGFAPRLLLFAFSLGRRRYLTSKFRLDVEDSKFSRLREIVNPPATTIGVVDPDEPLQSEPHAPVKPVVQPSRPMGPPAILGFELPAKPGTAWPPPLHQVRWLDLGMVDSRDDQRRVLHNLLASTTEPQTAAIVFALTSTPDRGAAAFIRELTQVVSRPVTVILTSGESLRKRSALDQAQQRINDWHTLATTAGVAPQHAIEIDLDHLTQSSAAKLAAAIGPDSIDRPAPARHLEAAFDLIDLQARKWGASSSPPTEAEQAELHRRIAKLYDHDRAEWRNLFGVMRSIGGSVSNLDISTMTTGANRVLNLLPAHLRTSPKWIAAGAATGALACIAAATLISPAAIAALPMWSTIGGSISGIIAMSRKGQLQEQNSQRDEQSSDRLIPVRSAALFAILLELQGRDEMFITRVLDAAISDDDELASFDAVESWLHQLRHQFDLALARELRS